MRLLILTALLVISACARHAPAPAPAPATPPAAQANAPAPADASASGSGRTETEQATASQESAGADTDHEAARSDSSLEQIAGLPPGAQLPDGKWKAGVNYDPVVPAQPTSVGPGKVEVLEAFWLACPHCYDFEPFIRAWLKTKPAYVEFVRVPVMWNTMHRAHARLYYTIEALGRPGLFEKAFDSIHQLSQRGEPPLIGGSDAETLQIEESWAAKNGVSAQEFANAYNSFSVNSNLQRAEELTQRYQIQGVPFIVVNGKYTSDIAKAGGEARLIELINDLAAAEHRH